MPERFRNGAFHLRRYTNVMLPLPLPLPSSYTIPTTPPYLADEFQLAPDVNRRLRVVGTFTCVVYRDRSFAVADPRVWNMLIQLRYVWSM